MKYFLLMTLFVTHPLFANSEYQIDGFVLENEFILNSDIKEITFSNEKSETFESINFIEKCDGSIIYKEEIIDVLLKNKTEIQKSIFKAFGDESGG